MTRSKYKKNPIHKNDFACHQQNIIQFGFFVFLLFVPGYL